MWMPHPYRNADGFCRNGCFLQGSCTSPISSFFGACWTKCASESIPTELARSIFGQLKRWPVRSMNYPNNYSRHLDCKLNGLVQLRRTPIPHSPRTKISLLPSRGLRSKCSKCGVAVQKTISLECGEIVSTTNFFGGLTQGPGLSGQIMIEHHPGHGRHSMQRFWCLYYTQNICKWNHRNVL